MNIALEIVHENIKTKKMCILSIKKNEIALQYVQDRYKTKEFCELAVEKNS